MYESSSQTESNDVMVAQCLRHTGTNRISETSVSEEWREAELRRAFRPGTWPYLGFLLITYYVTSYGREHPRIFWSFAVLVIATSAARLIIVYSGRMSLDVGSIWRRWLFGLLVISGLIWGTFLAATLQVYKLADSPSLLILVCTAGTTAGAITAYSPRLSLLTCYLLALLLPSMLVEVGLDDKVGKPMAAMSLLFLSFLVWQGRILNRLYQQKARDQALLTQRACELAEANEDLDRENRKRLAAESALLQSTKHLLLQQSELECRVLERTTELEKAKRAAEIASMGKSEFLAKMSHEIRTPMHGVLGMTYLALTADCSQEIKAYLEDIKTSAESLLQIINDVLDFSKIEARKMALESRPFHLKECIDSSVKSLILEAKRKDVEVSIEVDPLLPDRMRGDAVRVRQILINLIHNAIKFTDHGQVRITATRQMAGASAELHIAIEDTGCGVAVDKQKLIFEAFTQSDGSTTRHFGGTGLGLTISGQLVQLMQGRIWLESTLAKGSTFHIILPLLEVEDIGATASESEPAYAQPAHA